MCEARVLNCNKIEHFQEPFPLRPYLAESSTVMPLNGQVWGIAEMKSDDSMINSPVQNAKTNKKVVLLTNQGVQIVSLVKPMHMLMQLLLACHGPHHDAIKGYFQSQTEVNACATSVLLACMEAFRGAEIGMWATQAFLLYGGEPNFGGNYLMKNQATVSRQLGSPWQSNICHCVMSQRIVQIDSFLFCRQSDS